MSKLVTKCDDYSKSTHSKPESYDSIASSFVSGLQEGLTHVDVNIQAATNDTIKRISKEPFEFIGRIGGPSLTKLRKL